MTDVTVQDNRVVLTTSELDALNSLVKAGDRAAFYLAYYSMTDSGEALLQSKIATFSELAGGAAFAANRFLQDQYGGNVPGTYLGIYYLSQQVALSGYQAISDSVNNGGTGKIDDDTFFASAANAWAARGIAQLFPGNIYGPFGPGWSSLLTPGAAIAFAATAYAPDLGKKISDFPSNQLITIADGSTIAVDASGHVQAVFAPTVADANAALGYGMHVSENSLSPPSPAVLAYLLGGQTPAAFTETNTTTYNGDVNPKNTNSGFDPAKFATRNVGTDESDLILTQGDANGGNGDDFIIGGTAAQTLSGGDGNGIIWGRGGADIIDGGAGNDTIRGGAAASAFGSLSVRRVEMQISASEGSTNQTTSRIYFVYHGDLRSATNVSPSDARSAR